MPTNQIHRRRGNLISPRIEDQLKSYAENAMWWGVCARTEWKDPKLKERSLLTRIQPPKNSHLSLLHCKFAVRAKKKKRTGCTKKL
jgi:hypothetical protein